MRKFLTRLTTAATLSLAVVPALGLLAPANAAEPTATVPLNGLNLSNPAQAAEFLARVDAAGEQVCSAKARTNPIDFTMAACKVSVRAQAAKQLSVSQRQGLRVAVRSAPLAYAAR